MEDSQALLVQRRDRKDPNLMDEFEALVTTAGYTIVGTFDIVSPPSAKFGIRKGKVEEIKTWLEVGEPDVVLFSPTLKSSQVFRLMEEWEIEVRDRTQVILEIFDRHARTPQAKLQIEKARLEYELPFERHQIRLRLQKEHTGDRPTTDQVGIGEDLISLRMSHLRKRISNIAAKLEKISESQSLIRKKRVHEGFLEIAIAGYTNAGKSTLHDALTGSEVEIADKLFTTLGTKSSSLNLPGRRVVITDSVGFISDLPKALLEAFNTTLMQITEADVIILVVDSSDTIDEIVRKVQACTDTFSQVGANGIPILYALNKIDLLDNESIDERLVLIHEMNGSVVPISAKDDVNLELLLERLESILPHRDTYSISMPYGTESMSLKSWLYDEGIVIDESYHEHEITLTVTLSTVDAQRIMKLYSDVQVKRIDSPS